MDTILVNFERIPLLLYQGYSLYEYIVSCIREVKDFPYIYQTLSDIIKFISYEMKGIPKNKTYLNKAMK